MGKEVEKSEVVANKKWPRIVKLSEPLVFGDDVYKELSLRKPRAKDIKNVKLNDLKLADMLVIAAKLADLPSAAVLDDLCMEDVHRLTEAVGELL